MTRVYYNEIDPYCAQWLANLMDAGLIPRGDIDTRSIEDVIPNELRGYTQAHFFAGLGGWPYALQLAGWGTRPIWTGSCPCQPFSAAGKGAGFDDERHLWPAWQHLIEQCRPAIVFGEQVASKDADAWIDLVRADMEGMGYAFGCVPFPAAGVGAPHIRDRTYWVADASSAGLLPGTLAGVHRGKEGTRSRDGESQRLGADGRLADTDDTRLEGRFGMRERAAECATGARGVAGGMAHAARSGWREEYADGGRRGFGDSAQGHATRLVHGGGDCRPSPTNGPWRAADWLACTDGKWRPVEPGTFPLAHGIPNRVGRLRAYGNAIVPQVAAAFITAYMQARDFV